MTRCYRIFFRPGFVLGCPSRISSEKSNSPFTILEEAQLIYRAACFVNTGKLSVIDLFFVYLTTFLTQ
jgi:hypothetical protein